MLFGVCFVNSKKTLWFKFKPLLCSILVVAFISTSIISCVGDNAGIIPSTAPISTVIKYSQIQQELKTTLQTHTSTYSKQNNIKLSTTDGMADTDIASNIVKVDTNDEPSSTYIYTDNQSDYNVSLVGCTDGSFQGGINIGNHLESDIPAHSHAPRTTEYDKKWKAYDGGNGILDKDQRKYNYISYDMTPADDRRVKCYYKVTVDDAGDGHEMYYTLVNHVYTFGTFFKQINETAQAQAVQYAYTQSTDLKKIALEVGLPALVLFQVPWLRYRTRYEINVSAVDEMERIIKGYMNERVSKLNKWFTTNKQKIVDMSITSEKLKKYRQLMNVPDSVNDSDILKLLNNKYLDSEIREFKFGTSENLSKYEIQVLLANDEVLSASRNIDKFEMFLNNDSTMLSRTTIDTAATKARALQLNPLSRSANMRLNAELTADEIATLLIKQNSIINTYTPELVEEIGKNCISRKMIAKKFSRFWAKLIAIYGGRQKLNR